MKKILFVFVVAFVFVALVTSACATSKGTINSYVDPNFSAKNIKKIAVFPLRNARLAPSEALQINREITQAIQKNNPEIQIIGASESVDILNEKGLAEQWAKFLENYATSGIPDAGILHDIGTALGVDHILQGEIINVYQQDGDGWYICANTRITIHYAMLSIASNKTVWDASSDGIKNGGYYDSAPPIIDSVRLAQNKILEVLPF